jgi:HD-GYP domain-containing protein (c-di-GMP phosphodiesterase class II)
MNRLPSNLDNAPDYPQFFAVSPLLLLPRDQNRFGVFLKRDNGTYVLYAGQDEPFTLEQRQNLFDNNIKEVFIPLEHKANFYSYVDSALGELLEDDGLTIEARSELFTSSSQRVVESCYSKLLPPIFSRQHFDQMKEMVAQGVLLLTSNEASFKKIAGFFSQADGLYEHAIHCFVYTVVLLQSFGVKGKDLINLGLGAMLHDVGKMALPKDLVGKPKRLITASDQRELEKHPVVGVSICANLPLDQGTINLILFHHEKLDGTGYPSNLIGEYLPLPVKCLATANTYDNLLKQDISGSRLKPYEALSIIRDHRKNEVDPDIYKRFVKILSGAGIS